ESGDVDGAGPWAVELAEEDALPGAERKPSVADGDDDLLAHQARADVRGRVLLAGLDVLPAPAVADDALERRLEVPGDGRFGVLVDRQCRGSVRDEEQGGGVTVEAVQRALDLAGDVDELRPPLGLDLELVHPHILGPWTPAPMRPRPSRPPSSTRI